MKNPGIDPALQVTAYIFYRNHVEHIRHGACKHTEVSRKAPARKNRKTIDNREARMMLVPVQGEGTRIFSQSS